MATVTIFVSDLHMSTKDELEDFSRENETAFVKFLKHQSETTRGKEVDLVLLGDVLDIWQVATDEEKRARKSTDIDVGIREDLERRRVQQIIAAHPNAFVAFRDFLNADREHRRIVIIPGNHDHSLVHPVMQEDVRKAIAGADPALGDRILFSNYYDEPGLRTYAEHGCQYDANNDYDQFTKFGPECPGFYFVRIFWNRLEQQVPDIDIWWNIFRVIWERKLWHLLRIAYRFFRQYRKDERVGEKIDVPGVPFFGAEGQPIPGELTGKSLPEFPDILFSDGGDPERIFSTDLATENRLRMLYHDPENAEFRKEVDQILEEKFQGQAPPVPKDPIEPVEEFGLFQQDEYVAAVTGMFANPGEEPLTRPMKGDALRDETYDYVLFGHTHDAKKESIDDPGAIYFNTGTWTMKRDLAGKNVSRLCYVTIRKSPDGKVIAEQDYWSLD